ncbi:TetR/AcrR family transcriptional regulator [Streptosporangium fragile]|uniref:TetR/AcrR family transcriptional regulator n=1 Tax=Streptosporangium fragile TaxID=46186 RepID=A0ABP6IRQ6_9ACTN
MPDAGEGGEMASRRDWLDAGLTILAEQGARALTIERLTGRLGLTKGSFYHHFKGMGGFKTALLAHFEAECTTRFIDEVERAAPAAPEARLAHLVELVLSDTADPRLEIATRAWALQDEQVRAVQERVDRTRVAYLRDLWCRIGHDPVEAAHLGRLMYLVLVGAGHVLPPLPPQELRALYELTFRLALARR